MLEDQIRILIADDKQEICDSLEEAIVVELEKYGINTRKEVIIRKAFTEHAYEHGCGAINEGFKPDICFFDLVFNGYTGVDLYKYIKNHLAGKSIYLCLYTGVEKKYEKRKEAEILASQTNGLIKIVAKPNVSEVLDWFNKVLEIKYNLTKNIEEKDPFDLL